MDVLGVAGDVQGLDRAVVTFVALLGAAAVVAVAVRRIPIPYVSALALVGAALGIAGAQLGYTFSATPSLILFILLPGLLFESAFNLRWAGLRRDAVPVVVLATVGVAITMAVIAVLGHTALGLTIPVAILLGAALAPTDPVAVIGIFRRLGVPSRLATIIEAESLVNDGTGVVAFGLALTAASGDTLSSSQAVLDFVRLAGGGVALGLVVGVVLSRLTGRIDDEQVELTYTALGAYGSYVAAESVHVSGILAVVAAAVVLGNYGRAHGMSPRTQAAVDMVWSYVAFLLNSVVFLLIGLSTPMRGLLDNAGLILGAFAIVLVARAAAVYGLLGPLHVVRRSVPLRWQHVIVWSGMRGAVAVALVLSLASSGVAGTEQVRVVVYGVVLLGIALQGATIGPLTNRMVPVEQRSTRRTPV